MENTRDADPDRPHQPSRGHLEGPAGQDLTAALLDNPPRAAIDRAATRGARDPWTSTRLKTSTGVTDDPGRSGSLPAWAYLDSDVYEREKHELFYKTWHYAGWVGDLPAPGDYLTAELIDQSVIVMRGRDGALEGFHNVCQHRGVTACSKTAAAWPRSPVPTTPGSTTSTAA